MFCGRWNGRAWAFTSMQVEHRFQCACCALNTVSCCTHLWRAQKQYVGVSSLVRLFPSRAHVGVRVNLLSDCCLEKGPRKANGQKGKTINAGCARSRPSRRSSVHLNGPEISLPSVSGNPQDKAAGNFSHLCSFISCWQAKLLVHLECNSVLQPVYDKGSFS